MQGLSQAVEGFVLGVVAVARQGAVCLGEFFPEPGQVVDHDGFREFLKLADADLLAAWSLGADEVAASARGDVRNVVVAG